MDKESYLRNRLDDQIDWYSKKGLTNKRWFMGLTILQMTLAGLIVLLINTPIPTLYSHIIVSILGIGVMVAIGVCALYKFEENWIEYRGTAEMLKHVKFAAVEYDKTGDPEFLRIVSRVESIVSRRHTKGFIDKQ